MPSDNGRFQVNTGQVIRGEYRQRIVQICWKKMSRGAVSQKPIDLEGRKSEITSAEVALFTRAGGSLVVLQVNCRSIYDKVLEFWNLKDTYNPDVIIGTELWLRGDTENAEVFRADYTTFRRDRSVREGIFYMY